MPDILTDHSEEALIEHQPHMRYKICVSGAVETDVCSKGALELAREVGREVVRQSGILVTGATTGIPYWAAIGAKEEGGLSIGLSPAATEREHIRTYRLPTNYFDVIIYTGFNYSGRNLLLTRSSDAVILVCGRMGSLNEFTIAFEDKKPIGVLVGSGGMADMVREIVERAHRGPGRIVYDSSPQELVAKVIRLVEEERAARE
ncbi:LOG family protein [Candidatus Parcubacteria bacterium]|nr:LOG family protein [Candidatus Parcubacteria bacterium]